MEKVQLCNAVQEGDARLNVSPKDSFPRGCSSGRATMLKKLLQSGPAQYFLLLFFILSGLTAFSQIPEHIYKSSIMSVRFHLYGDQYSLPVYNINSGDQLELNFDDMDNDVKSYYYTFQPCDYNWEPVDLSTFNYIKGFTQQRISIYRYSSISLTRYTHYQAILPDRSTTITMSGNYLLKVFLDGDTSKLAFTRRLLVLDKKSAITAQIVQPFRPQYSQTHQKVRFAANIAGLNSFSAAQQVKVVILQNNRWDNLQKDIAPTFVRGSTLDYSTEDCCTFQAGKEWRWLDLRSLRLQSDRVDTGIYKKKSTELFLKTDVDRSSQRYAYYRDLNGMYSAETYETINPYWQADYATVHFSLAAPGGTAYANKDVYVAGQLTDYEFNNRTKMVFNAEKSMYECTLFLKQGYYNYTYIAVDKNDPLKKTDLEGDYWEAENTYTILMYYRSFTDRNDQLIGVSKISSRTDRPGISF